MRNPEPIVPETDRPSDPDNMAYKFNCCSNPDVWEYSDGDSRCRTCGQNWTQKLKND